MFSGLTLTNRSGSIFGGHQKVDRAAFKILQDAVPLSNFPHIKQILHFEGKNGPDGVKRKSAGKDEPWHFYDPFDPDDSELLTTILEHYHNLVSKLQKGNAESAAFEAAWLAHALVDGMTPAHHFPYEEILEELRGEGRETRTSIKEKWFIKGATRRESVTKNWKMWGPKGLILTHGLFDWGAAIAIAPMNLSKHKPSKYDYKSLHHVGIAEVFKREARGVALLKLFDEYYKWGWNPKLARQMRTELAPAMVRVVTLAWYSALYEAGLIKPVVKIFA